MNFLESYLPLDPLLVFAIVMFCILVIPKIFEKIHLPGLVGLLLCGLLLGANGLNLDKGHNGRVFSDIGKLMVMFFAGLEIDYEDFILNKYKSLVFGMATFLLPLGAGMAIGLSFGYSFNTSLLIGSLLASHTLLAMPILIRYGVVNVEAVNVTVGATIFTDIAALIVLTACVSLHTVGFEPKTLAVRLIGALIYLPVLLFVARKVAKFFIPKMHNNEDSKTILILVIMVVAAIGAEMIHLEGIVGAFIGGLAVGEIIRGSKTKAKLETLGNTLFIPAFFITVGALINPMSFLKLRGSNLWFVILIVGGLILAKYLASFIASKILQYKKMEMLTMWSLSTPQVAATLAAALVAFETKNADGVRLINESVFDTIIILVAVTSILGLTLTEKFVKRIKIS
jgi:Kef-type K+ transport system membrane component KefB